MNKSFSNEDFDSLDGSNMSYDSIGKDMNEIAEEAIKKYVEKYGFALKECR